ncbi:flavin reductase family protein [Devosia riboflavina]|uniref:flavin reductase family protein n=1 Tax=Devosia riboflavina TaxID=46914 RepID=UPI000AFF2D6A|nr:flavin reductase family protein [Devosia riboflavina]
MNSAEANLALRRAFSLFPTGVVAMCGHNGNEPVGMAVNSFSTVSLEPPLVSVCIARQSSTWPKLNALPRIGLSILGADQEPLSRQLSSRNGDRFRDVALESGEETARFIPGATLWLDCTIADRLSGGDHEIILFEIRNTTLFPDIRPLVFHQSQYLGLSRAS